MGWGQIFKVNSDLTTPLNVTLGNKSNVAGESASDTIFSFIKNINNNAKTLITSVANVNSTVINKSAVKSIQRGITNEFNGGIINISSVDMNKSVLIATNLSHHRSIEPKMSPPANNTFSTGIAYLSSSTKITITPCYAEQDGQGGTRQFYYPPIAWQVIEFY